MSAENQADLRRLVEWIEEQRQVDRERLVQVGRVVEQLRDELRDHSALITHLSEARPGQNGGGQIDAINQLREQVASIERTLDSHLEASARAEQILAAQHERETRQVGELVQQVGALARTADAADGRLRALAEEIRRLREEHAPVVQLVSDVERSQSGLLNRLTIVEENQRRTAGFQSAIEQGAEKQRTELGRLDSQLKLQELRFSRELAEIRRITDESLARADERLKPVAELTKQVAALAGEREGDERRIESLAHELEAANSEIGRVDSQVKTDRAASKRTSELVDSLGQQIAEALAGVWKLGERITALAAELQDVRAALDGLAERSDQSERRIGQLDEERQRLSSALAALGIELTADRREVRDQRENLLSQVNAEMAAIRSQLSAVRELAIEHLRRTVAELQQQLRELEATQSSG